MNVFKLTFACLALVVLAACSTTYGGMGWTGGVEAMPVTNDVYRISARGNAYTGSTTIQDYALLKAAETAMAKGATHFTILGGQDASSNTVGQTSGTFTNYGGGFAVYNPGFTYDIVKPGQDINVRVWTPGPKDAIPPNTFNASEVFTNINPRVKRSET